MSRRRRDFHAAHCHQVIPEEEEQIYVNALVDDARKLTVTKHRRDEPAVRVRRRVLQAEAVEHGARVVVCQREKHDENDSKDPAKASERRGERQHAGSDDVAQQQKSRVDPGRVPRHAFLVFFLPEKSRVRVPVLRYLRTIGLLDERVADGRSRGDDLLRLALARRRRDWEEAVGLAHYCVVCLRLIDSLEASARAMRRERCAAEHVRQNWWVRGY